MQEILDRVRKRHLTLMGKTIDILRNILHDVTPEQAATLRDGADGWTVLEVLGHLRDFDEIFYNRAVMIISEEMPALPAYDHEKMAVERAYNAQNLREVFDQLQQSRTRFIAFFREQAPECWERAGVHPESGHFTLLDALMQVGHHDVTHIEQITRILTQR